MKTFGQHLSEQPDQSKLDRIIYSKPLDSKRVKQLTRPYPVFQHLDLEDWMGFPPPSNSSQETTKEIHYIISLGEFRTQWEDDMIMSDTKIMKAFQNYLDEYGLEVNTLDRIKEYKEQSEPVILALKQHYKRPRPIELAKEMGLALETFPLKTANTPSYPSGHATQGRLVARLLADEVPLEHRKNILDIGKRIAEGRQIAGAHYPSDTEFGYKLGDRLYDMATSGMEPDLKLEDVLKEEKTEVTIADFMPPANQAGRRTTIYEGAALVGFFKNKDIMKSKEWRMGGAPKFRMKDWYDGFIEKGVQMGQEKVFKDAWKVFCNELGSAKFSKSPKDFIWARIDEYYNNAPNAWQTRAFKNNTADAIVITEGTANGLLSLMKSLQGKEDDEVNKMTKTDNSNMITCEGLSWYQVSLKKGMGDSRIGKVAPMVVDLGQGYHGLEKGIHQPGDAFEERFLDEDELHMLSEGWFSDTVDKVRDKVKGFIAKAKKWLSKIANKFFSKALKGVKTFIKRDKSVKAANKIVDGLKEAGVVITEDVISEASQVKVTKGILAGINEFNKAFASGTPIKNELSKMIKKVDALNGKKNPKRPVDPILLTGTTDLKSAISTSELSALKKLYNLEIGAHIEKGEGTPFNTVLKLTSNMIGFVYINGLLDALTSNAKGYEQIESGVSKAIIGMSADIEGEAKFGNTALPVVICYGGKDKPVKLGKRADFIAKKKEDLGVIGPEHSDYPLLVIRINKLEPHNSVNLFLLTNVETTGKGKQAKVIPSWMNVSIATSSGSGFSTKVESNTITKTYMK